MGVIKMLRISTTTTIDEVIEMLRRLSSVAMQVVDDVDSAVKTNDLELFLDRMVANAEDLQRALDVPQQVAQDTLQGETE
jgi:lipopolysaccharide biosynthesis protein